MRPVSGSLGKDLLYGNVKVLAEKLVRLLREYRICSKTLSFRANPIRKATRRWSCWTPGRGICSRPEPRVSDQNAFRPYKCLQ